MHTRIIEMHVIDILKQYKQQRCRNRYINIVLEYKYKHQRCSRDIETNKSNRYRENRNTGEQICKNRNTRDRDMAAKIDIKKYRNRDASNREVEIKIQIIMQK